MKFVFFAVLIVAWLAAHRYVFVRLRESLRLAPAIRFTIGSLMILMAVSWPVSRMLSRIGENLAVHLFQGAGSYWMGFMAVLVMTIFATDLLIALPARIGNRRLVLSQGALVAARKVSFLVAVASAVVVSTIAMAVATGPVAVRKVDIASPAVPAALDGRTLLFLSDIHHGSLVGVDDLDRIEAAVKSVQFDVILFVGDLTDEENGGDGSAFERFASWGRLGSSGRAFAVTGNHERYSGGDAVVGRLQQAGIQVLRQQAECNDAGLCLAGVDDPAMLPDGVGFDAAVVRAVSGVPDDAFLVLLSHQPVMVDFVAGTGVDLMVSGHTHHGQFPPATFFTPLFYPYWAGLYRIRDMFLYVSSGAGFWGPPLRLGSHPEVVALKLRRI
ncbi:MAG TPA: metallophosphoesterase [Myxococcota bacterium]|nr:metallophosphoesterase [Myxococcota bacterium]HOD00759.1 metallophosphoesterase [Myxococcota bacterium]HOH77892.1 metallophosphoesterase [Myxococcota bacterium]HPV04356.1 metallophosphoesterase [Myxococcota bacterium]